jgi:GDP-L-fucose synthase
MAEATRPKIYVAGHRGMVGAAICRRLKQQNAEADLVVRTHAELDLIDQGAVDRFFAEERPDQVYLAAAKVGGIWANNAYPAEFIY